MRKKFAELCKNTITNDPQSIVLIGDISHFALRETEKIAPERFYNIGICEQSMVGVASGLALEGMRPIIHTISPFLVERAYEQIKVDIGYQNTEVTIITVGGTYDYSDLGCTHHCYNDITLMRSIPNLQVFEPGNSQEFESLFNQTWGNGQPKYFRLSNHENNNPLPVKPGEILKIRDSKNNKWIFTSGELLNDISSIDQESGILYVTNYNEVINKKEIKALFNPICEFYSLENHFVIGGLGDFISEEFEIYVKKIGINNEFLLSYGSYEDLKSEAKLDRENILNKIYG